MKTKEFFRELHRRNVWKVAVGYTAIAIALLEVLTHLFHNFEAPVWVLKVVTTLLIAGLPVTCLMAWGFEFKEGGVRSVPRPPKEANETRPALAPPETAAPPSIAVLPFEDMSPEQDQKYLGSGIAEELLNALAGIEGLKVAARTSSFTLGARGASMKEIGDTLHVRHVLEGSVRRSGRKLRVTAQLIDVESGFHLYSQAYDRSVEDIFDIQNEIAREIAEALLPRLGLGEGVRLVKHGTTNLEAYNLWLKAREWFLAPDQTRLEAAIQQLKQALALDHNYWDAWGDLAALQAHRAVWASNSVRCYIESWGSAAIALQHSPDNVNAMLVQAGVEMAVMRDAEAAARWLERARVTGVDESYWAYVRAYVLDGPLGRYAEAIAYLKAAEKKDPLALGLKQALIEMYWAAGRIAEAVATAEAVLARDVKSVDTVGFAAVTYAMAGDVARADECMNMLSSMVDDNDTSYLVIRFAIGAATGDCAALKPVLQHMVQRYSEGHGPAAYVIGAGYAALGDYDEALAWLARAVDRHDHLALAAMPARFRNHPVIGKDPRFLALLKRMGLEGEKRGAG